MGKFIELLGSGIAAASCLFAFDALSQRATAPDHTFDIAHVSGATEVEAVMVNGVLTVVDVGDPDHKVVAKVDIGSRSPK